MQVLKQKMNIALFQCVALQMTKYKKQTQHNQLSLVSLLNRAYCFRLSNIKKKKKILSSQNTAYYAGFHILGPLNDTCVKKKKN